MITCPRCGDDTFTTSCSYFSTDDICLTCKTEEKAAPGFAAARDAEADACRAGNYNFPGVGLSAADRAFLAERRLQRVRR